MNEEQFKADQRSERFDTRSQANMFEVLHEIRQKRRKELETQGFFRVMDEKSALRDSGTFLGTCEDKCPEYERYERESHLDLSQFEMIPGTEKLPVPRVDHERAVKKYHRPAAGNEAPLPEDVRTPSALKKTMIYLMNDLLVRTDFPFTERHKFIRDRTRAIRQDFTLQNIRDGTCIELHERIARFHILSGHRLCEEDVATFDAFQNTEQLRKVLQSLSEFYHDLYEETKTISNNEPEFRGYYILTHLQDENVIRKCSSFPPKVFSSEPVQFALDVFFAVKTSNYVRFFRLVEEATYLNGCLMHEHFSSVQKQALKIMNKAYPKDYVFPITELVSILGFEDSSHAEAVCSHYGIEIVRSDGVIGVRFQREHSLIEPESSLAKRRSDRLIEIKSKKSEMNEIVEGLNLVWQTRRARASSRIRPSKVSELALPTSNIPERITKAPVPIVSTSTNIPVELPSHTTSMDWSLAPSAIERHESTTIPFTTKEFSSLKPSSQSNYVPSINLKVQNLTSKASETVSSTPQSAQTITIPTTDQRFQQILDTNLIRKQLIEVFSKINRRQILTKTLDLWRTSTIEILKETRRKKEERDREIYAKFASIQRRTGQKRKSYLLNLWRAVSATLKAHKAKQRHIASNLAVTSPISPINDQAKSLSRVIYRIEPINTGASDFSLFSQTSSDHVKTINIPSLIQFVLERKPRLQFFLKLVICTDAINRFNKLFLDFVSMFRMGKVDSKWNRSYQNAYDIETLSLYKCANRSDRLTNSSIYICIQSLIFYSPINEISMDTVFSGTNALILFGDEQRQALLSHVVYNHPNRLYRFQTLFDVLKAHLLDKNHTTPLLFVKTDMKNPILESPGAHHLRCMHWPEEEIDRVILSDMLIWLFEKIEPPPQLLQLSMQTLLCKTFDTIICNHFGPRDNFQELFNHLVSRSHEIVRNLQTVYWDTCKAINWPCKEWRSLMKDKEVLFDNWIDWSSDQSIAEILEIFDAFDFSSLDALHLSTKDSVCDLIGRLILSNLERLTGKSLMQSITIPPTKDLPSALHIIFYDICYQFSELLEKNFWIPVDIAKRLDTIWQSPCGHNLRLNLAAMQTPQKSQVNDFPSHEDQPHIQPPQNFEHLEEDIRIELQHYAQFEQWLSLVVSENSESVAFDV